MCYYNGCRVSKAEFIRLMAIEKEIKNLKLSEQRQVVSGFTYPQYPILIPTPDGKDFNIVPTHWEYVPAFVRNSEELQEFRKRYSWLNAKAENLFTNEKGRSSIYQEGALTGRCLILSTGFVEWRHIPKLGKKGQPLKATEKIPYFIRLKDKEYFFMAGVMRTWTNIDRQQSANTFAGLTTVANYLMKQIHNTKERMPTILPEDLAWEWMQPNLTIERVQEIAKWQVPSEEMEAWPIAKEFLKIDDQVHPEHYENLPPLKAA